MLPPELIVLACRQDFADAQQALAGASVNLGSYEVGWYGTGTSDERGSFAIVDPMLPLAPTVGEILQVAIGSRSVFVYVIGSLTGLGLALALARRPFLGISLLAFDPVLASVGVVHP
jgi:hypothetical protein